MILKGTLGTWVAGFLGIIFSFAKMRKPERGTAEKEIEVGRIDALKIGEGKFLPHLREPVWVIKTEGGYVALSAVCTHLKCILEYDKEEKSIKCPCHAAVFDLNGNVLQGPPPRPLPRYRVEIRGDRVYVLF